jgi:Tol biopolymer transport system component
VASVLYQSGGPQWSPDSREIVFSSKQKGPFDLYRKAVGGTDEELIFHSNEDKWATQWLKDGSVLAVGETVFRLSLFGGRKPTMLLRNEYEISIPKVSPDERWIAYSTNRSGREEVYVAIFPSFKDNHQVSNSGGCNPQWRKDGRELFYLGLDGKLMSVDVKSGSDMETSAPKTLFQTPIRVDPNHELYDVSGDGKRFVFGEPVSEGSQPVTVVLNSIADLKQ